MNDGSLYLSIPPIYNVRHKYRSLGNFRSGRGEGLIATIFSSCDTVHCISTRAGLSDLDTTIFFLPPFPIVDGHGPWVWHSCVKRNQQFSLSNTQPRIFLHVEKYPSPRFNFLIELGLVRAVSNSSFGQITLSIVWNKLLMASWHSPRVPCYKRINSSL